MESLGVSVSIGAKTVGSVFSSKLGIRQRSGSHGQASRIPLTCNAKAFYIRRNRKDRNRVISVFDQDGKRCYTIERKSRLSPVWQILDVPSRRDVATVHAGLIKRFVDFHNKQGLRHRKLTHPLHPLLEYRTFYLTDGAAYRWYCASQYLEKVINPGGGDEETYIRVAHARLMRRFRFDYELLYDPEMIDPEVVLATGFVSMVTEWGLGYVPETRGPTAIPKSLVRRPQVQESDPCTTETEALVAYDDVDAQSIVTDNSNYTHSRNSVSPPALPRRPETVDIENRVYLLIENEDGTVSEPQEISRNKIYPKLLSNEPPADGKHLFSEVTEPTAAQPLTVSAT